MKVCRADRRLGIVQGCRVAREMPDEGRRSLRDREKVGLETGDHQDIGELDRAENERPRGAREELGAVPNLDRDRCCLTSMSRAEDVTMWWEAPESITKMPGTDLMVGTAAEMNADASES